VLSGEENSGHSLFNYDSVHAICGSVLSGEENSGHSLFNYDSVHAICGSVLSGEENSGHSLFNYDSDFRRSLEVAWGVVIREATTRLSPRGPGT